MFENGSTTAVVTRSIARIFFWVICLCSPLSSFASDSEAHLPATPTRTYSQLADDGVQALKRLYYVAGGRWRDCPQQQCWVHNSDWGSDTLTATLYLSWRIRHDADSKAMLTELAGSARTFEAPCNSKRCTLWSDAPMWDAVADVHEYEAAPDALALSKAEKAFWAVESSPAYALGNCPEIRFQRPYGRGGGLKTLETDSNGIKAALLLYTITRDNRYLQIARTRYAAVRKYFLDPQGPLYSVYVFDDGKQCTQLPHRYFASVNGNMIWNGTHLALLTGDQTYRRDALATAHAVMRELSDSNDVFANLQAENDVAEPLVEAMSELASAPGGGFARTWILANASAAFSARREDGSFGRFFDGPPPAAPVTAWATNGGFALELAASAIAPNAVVAADRWRNAQYVTHRIEKLPSIIRVDGSGMALIGTIGDVCCEAGHARIFVDRVETANHTGVWQNKSSSGQRLHDSVLFAWRWPKNGTHYITIAPGVYNAKEGGTFMSARSYMIIGSRD